MRLRFTSKIYIFFIRVRCSTGFVESKISLYFRRVAFFISILLQLSFSNAIPTTHSSAVIKVTKNNTGRSRLLEEVSQRRYIYEESALEDLDTNTPSLPHDEGMYDNSSINKQVNGEKRFYFRGGASLVKLNDLSSSIRYKRHKPIYEIALGYHFNEVIRADLGFMYGKFGLKSNNDLLSNLRPKQQISHFSSLLNMHINLSDREGLFIPYFNAGLGYGINKLNGYLLNSGSSNITVTGKKSGNIVWNVGIGSLVNFNDRFSLDIGFRYSDYGKAFGNSILTNNKGSLRGSIDTKRIRGRGYYIGLLMNF